MNEVKIFNSEEFGDIRTVQLNNEIYFLGKDIAEALGYSNTRDALATHVADEDKNTVVISDGKRGNPNQTVINESGLYALIFGSKLDAAKRFKHWVTSEVLPAIRKTGSYQMSKPEGKELLAMAVLEAQKTIEQQSNEIERMKPKEIFADAVSTSHTSILIGDVILGLLVGFDMDVIGLGDRDAEQWMEKMLKDFPVLQKENIVNE